MAVAVLTQIAILLPIAFILFTTTIHAQCNTDQNPSCAGNSQFEQLCCAPGSVCYWSNRNGDPACCPAGTDCQGDGGPAFVASNQVQATTYFAQTTYSSTIPQESTVTYFSSTWSPKQSFATLSTVTNPAVVVVTDTFPVVQTVPVETGGAYVTVTQVQVVAEAATQRSNQQTVVRAAVVATVMAAAFALFG